MQILYIFSTTRFLFFYFFYILYFTNLCSNLCYFFPSACFGFRVLFFSRCFKVVYISAELLTHVQLLAAPWTVAHRVPLSMEFSRQEYWNGLHFLGYWFDIVLLFFLIKKFIAINFPLSTALAVSHVLLYLYYLSSQSIFCFPFWFILWSIGYLWVYSFISTYLEIFSAIDFLFYLFTVEDHTMYYFYPFKLVEVCYMA